MLRALRDYLKVLGASRALGRAGRLTKRGDDEGAIVAYREVIRRVDELGSLPTDFQRFSFSDVGHASIRLAAYGDLAVLLDRAGDHEAAKEYARGVLELCRLVPRKPGDASDVFAKWERWARAFTLLSKPGAPSR